MRATTMAMFVVAALFVAGCAGSADICSLAADHLKSCTGVAPTASGNCSAENAARVLNADCSKLANQASRSSYFFDDLYDWLYGEDGGEGGGEEYGVDPPNGGEEGLEEPSGGGGEEPGGEPPPEGGEPGEEGGGGEGGGGGGCKCDEWCTTFQDCCPGCKQGSSEQSEQPEQPGQPEGPGQPQPPTCFYEGNPYPDGAKVGPFVCENGKWVTKVGCFYNGQKYPDGSRVGPLVCHNGTWVPEP